MTGVADFGWVLVALGGLAAGTAHMARDLWERRLAVSRFPLWLLAAALAFGVALAERWLRTGFGPFATLFDILLSSLFSLSLVYGLVIWRLREMRDGAPVALAILTVMGVWLGAVPRTASALPAAFDSYWLWLHLATGKLFLGCALAAASSALVLLVRQWRRRPPDQRVEQATDLAVWRLMAVAFVAHGLMLIAGAVWAQDAWGRYWGWDPLESWSLMTWLLMGFALHLRTAFRMRPAWGWTAVAAVFVVAFLTLFGVPFLSSAPHRGVL